MSLQPCRPPPALSLVNETGAHGPEIEALLDRAFGPGRFAKSSERVREIADFAGDLSFVAVEAGAVVGVVRMWRVDAGEQPVIFLGPLAVEASERRAGLGAMLVERACEAAKAAGEAAVVLVGDLPYFQRVGFEMAPDVGIPGPVDPRRVLYRSFDGGVPAGPIQSR
ncbi:MAG: N-acetyltransferase [Pseudomonadota bacterium]